MLNGTKQFISGAGVSDLYVAMVRTGDDGPRVSPRCVVPKDAPGLSFGPQREEDGLERQPTRQVIFEDCRVPVDESAADEGDGFRIAMAGLDGGRLNIAACSLGGAQAALDKALAYTGERKAFGKTLRVPGAAVQAGRHGDRTRGRALLLLARRGQARPKAPDAGKLCAMAKRLVTDTGFDVANDALQLTAATATCTTTASRSWCATCASTRSSKAPTRSCA